MASKRWMILPSGAVVPWCCQPDWTTAPAGTVATKVTNYLVNVYIGGDFLQPGGIVNGSWKCFC